MRVFKNFFKTKNECMNNSIYDISFRLINLYKEYFCLLLF